MKKTWIVATICAVAVMMLAAPVMAAIVDSFVFGSTSATITNSFTSGSTSGINSELTGLDDYRYWHIFATGGASVSGSINTTTPPGAVVLTHTGPAKNPAVGLMLEYRFGAGTDLTGYTALNILGSGEGKSDYDIALWDNDGSKWGKIVTLDTFSGLSIDLSALELSPGGNGGPLNLASITSFYIYAKTPYGTITHTINEINLAPVPIPGAVWLLASGLAGVALYRRKVKGAKGN